ncbi:MAG: imidazole glycerol phosphate synthase subunit HisH [Sedimentisphaerales bacterium]|jgi:glutamine amidotransferase|nr:imidazole glycerol phosphate synthase subunit HisH [Sedimentisphaerales bacterium]
MIAVIDYKVGNVESVCKAFRHIGCPVVLSRSKQHILAADGLVLPGVAAFGYAMDALGNAAGYIKDAALAGKPLLGICVGYQILFEQGMAFGTHTGLGLVKGQVIPIPEGRTILHMGWNQVEIPSDMEIFRGLGPARYFYFAHSYYHPSRMTRP